MRILTLVMVVIEKEWRKEFGVDKITEESISRVASSGEAYLHSSPAKDGKPVIVVTSAKHFPNVSNFSTVVECTKYSNFSQCHSGTCCWFFRLLCRLFTGRTVIGQREALCVLDREGSIAASTRWWNIFRYLWLERLQAKKWRSEVYKVPGKNTSSKVHYITAIFYLLLSQGAPFLFLHVQIDLFFKYYPKRLGQVLFVDAPFVFQPGWAMIKPWVGKYAALVRYFLYIIRLCIYETVLSCTSGWHWLASSIQTLRWWKFSSRMLVNSLRF